MTNNQFDLESALAKLHEEDWLHPYQAALHDMPIEQETAIDKKYQQKSYWIAQFSHLLMNQYQQKSYWIAQFSHLLMNQYQQSSHACARILKLTNHKYVARAVVRFPSKDFQTLAKVHDELTGYAKTQGVNVHG